MKAGIVSDDILYVMAVVPGIATGVAILGAHQSTIYRDRPGRIRYSEAFSVDGDLSRQVLEITSASREFYPLVIVCETYQEGYPITSVRISARLEFCVDMRYVLCKLFWQDESTALETAPDDNLREWGLWPTNAADCELNAMRHAITFIRRAKANQFIREGAWGDEQTRFGKVIKASATPVKKGTARSVRRLYLTDGIRVTPKAEMKTWALSLDGEVFHVSLDEEHPNEYSNYPVTIKHVSSTMTMDTLSGSTDKVGTLGDLIIVSDILDFYKRLFGKAAKSTIVLLADPS